MVGWSGIEGGNVKVVHKTESVQFLETVKWLEVVVLGGGVT